MEVNPIHVLPKPIALRVRTLALEQDLSTDASFLNRGRGPVARVHSLHNSIQQVSDSR